MHHAIFERELVHLERVIALARQEAFPPAYWRDRVKHLESFPQALRYRNRIAHLSSLVAKLNGASL